MVDHVRVARNAEGAGIQRGASLRQQVYDTLLDLIVTGQLALGEHLTEPDLSRRLGVSRQPVREALHELAIDGWVDRIQGKGAFVRSPTIDEVRDLFAVRTILEGEAAALACDFVDEHFEARLAELLERGVRAVDQGDAMAVVSANTEFHVLIAEMSGNSVLQDLISSLSLRVAWLFGAVALERGKESWAEHEAITEAIRKKDRKQASELVRLHTGRTRASLERASTVFQSTP